MIVCLYGRLCRRLLPSADKSIWAVSFSFLDLFLIGTSYLTIASKRAYNMSVSFVMFEIDTKYSDSGVKG